MAASEEPEALSAGSISALAGDGEVTISQSVAPSGGTESYTRQLYRSTSGGSKGSAVSGATSLPYVDEDVTNDTTYYYTLEVDDGVDTDDTSQVSATPEAAGTVWFEEDWSSFTSLPNDDSAPGIHYAVNASIQTGTLFDGSTGKFVRCQYTGGGTESTATVQLAPPDAGTDKPREIWDEYYMRVPSDWSIVSDDKTNFVMEDWSDVGSDPGLGGAGAGQGEVWRWAYYLRNNSGYGGPYWRLENFSNGGSVTSFFNNSWIRVRHHYKMASNSSASDGIFEVWLNDTKIDEQLNIQTDSAAAAFFNIWIFGANADPNGTGSRDIGRARRYISNPGW